MNSNNAKNSIKRFIYNLILNIDLYYLNSMRQSKLKKLLIYNEHFDIEFLDTLRPDEKRFQNLSAQGKMVALYSLSFEDKFLKNFHTNVGCLSYLYIYFRNVDDTDIKDTFSAQLVLDSFQRNLHAIEKNKPTKGRLNPNILDLEKKLKILCEKAVIAAQVKDIPHIKKTNILKL